MLITDHARPVPSLTKIDLNPGDVRSALGSVPSGVAAICAEIDGAPVGFVASSFSVGISFDPPIVLFAAQNTSTTWPLLREARRVGVSILGRDQEDVCMQLASRSRDRFAGVETLRSEEGGLFIADSACLLTCSILREVPAGDHHIVLLQVRELAVDGDREPLVYHKSAFRRLTAPRPRTHGRGMDATTDLADDWLFPAPAHLSS